MNIISESNHSKYMWSSIIGPEEKIRIDNLITDIFNVLIEKEKKVDSFDVYMGRSGIYLFLLFYQLGNKKDTKNIDYIFESIIDKASKHEITDYAKLTFYAEIAWLMCYMHEKNLIDFNLDDYLEDIDESLFQGMLFLLEKKEYGCVNGAISIGMYFYYRYILGDKTAGQYLDEFVDLLRKTAVESDMTVEWISIVDYSSYRQGYNLGIAHGIPGVLLFLSKLYIQNIKKEIVANMIIKTTNFLLLQKHSLKNHKSYFYNVSSDLPQIGHDSRLAWCYGDLSVSYSIYKACMLKGIERPEVKKEALDILINTSYRTNLSEVNVVDAGLCHGTSGLAHIYNRLYQQTGLVEFRKAALYWYGETLKMSKYKNEYVGFGIPYYQSEAERKINEQYNLSFLTGIAGIGLSLLAAVHPLDPYWDKYLLLS